MQCALPVTGSSLMPRFGAKKRLSKSKGPPSAPAACRTRGRLPARAPVPGGVPPADVTMTPRSMGRTRASAPMSGARPPSSPAGTSTSQSGVVAGPWARCSTSASRRPRAAASAARGASPAAGLGGCDGKSMRIQELPAGAQSNTPAFRVWKEMGLPAGTRPVSQRAWAEPRVAWPQRATSPPGVNQRMSQASPSAAPPLACRRSRKAVSLRLFSMATACIHSSSPPRCVKSTAAGLPAMASGVNASTCTKSSSRRTARSRRMSNHCSDPCTTAEGPRSSKPHCLYSPSKGACASSSICLAAPQRSVSARIAST
mmetsp:Transcript_43506/g.134455  ORF Transcript_43506/g.134455 Transcript_43506/m.134455 type:complete len:314 (+) Transcript_43506:297-1238(+)